MKFTSMAVAAGLLTLGMGTSEADAQSPSSKRYEAMSAQDIASLLTEFDITSQLRASRQPGNAPVLQATTPGGAQFLVGFFQCSDAASATGCLQLMISTAQPSAGATFDDLNMFNGVSSVTTVVFEPSNQILIFGRNVFLPGGVGHENMKLNVALFLEDMSKFAAAQAGSTASVAFERRPDARGKIEGLGATAENHGAADRWLTSADAGLEVEIAIANSTGVDYAVAYDGLRR